MLFLPGVALILGAGYVSGHASRVMVRVRPQRAGQMINKSVSVHNLPKQFELNTQTPLLSRANFAKML